MAQQRRTKIISGIQEIPPTKQRQAYLHKKETDQELFDPELLERTNQTLLKKTVSGFKTPLTKRFHAYLNRLARTTSLYRRHNHRNRHPAFVQLVSSLNQEEEPIEIPVYRMDDTTAVPSAVKPSENGNIILDGELDHRGIRVYTWFYEKDGEYARLYRTPYAFDDFRFGHLLRLKKQGFSGSVLYDLIDHHYEPFRKEIARFHKELKRLANSASIMIISRAGEPILQTVDELHEYIQRHYYRNYYRNYIMFIPNIRSRARIPCGWYIILNTSLPEGVDVFSVGEYKIRLIFPFDDCHRPSIDEENTYTVLPMNSIRVSDDASPSRGSTWKIFGYFTYCADVQDYLRYLRHTFPQKTILWIPIFHCRDNHELFQKSKWYRFDYRGGGDPVIIQGMILPRHRRWIGEELYDLNRISTFAGLSPRAKDLAYGPIGRPRRDRLQRYTLASPDSTARVLGIHKPPMNTRVIPTRNRGHAELQSVDEQYRPTKEYHERLKQLGGVLLRRQQQPTGIMTSALRKHRIQSLWEQVARQKDPQKNKLTRRTIDALENRQDIFGPRSRQQASGGGVFQAKSYLPPNVPSRSSVKIQSQSIRYRWRARWCRPGSCCRTRGTRYSH